MTIINEKFREEIHNEVNRVLNKLEEQERFLNRNGRSLSGDQVYHAFSGLNQYAAGMFNHFAEKDKSD